MYTYTYYKIYIGGGQRAVGNKYLKGVGSSLMIMKIFWNSILVMVA